jgi:hypothetical protein
MAGPYIYDRVKETSGTGGTGALTLAGAAAGFRSFSVVGNGNACYYCAEDGTNWEVGVGTYTSSGTTLSRDTVLASSNAGALVSFPATAKNVFIPGGPASWYGTPLTPGSVLFALANGVLGQDNANAFWDAANQRLGLGTAAPAERLHVKAGHLRMENVAAPGACSAALAGAGAGNVDNGTHAYKVTFVTAAGETTTGNAVTVTVANKTTNGQVSLTAVPTGAAGLVTQRKVYRSKAGGGPFYLLTTIADNTTTTYTDNTADASLGALEPAYNSTAGKLLAGSTAAAGIQVASTQLSGRVVDNAGFVRNVTAFAAKAGALLGTATASITSGTAALTITGAALTAADVGKLCCVEGAGAAGAPLASVITAVGSGTTCTLADNASTTVSNKNVLYGWDDTAAFQAAVDAGAGTVVVPNGNYIVSQLQLKTNVWLRGTGFAAQIFQRGGTSGHHVIQADAAQIHCGLYELTLNGVKSCQSVANNGVHFDNATTSGDEIHTVYNCFITNYKNDGIYLGNQVREVRVYGCYVLGCDGVGIETAANGTDNSFVQIDVGQSGLEGIKTAGANNRWTNVKSFDNGKVTSGSGYGFHVTGDNNEFSGCESQDNPVSGWYLHGCNRAALSNATADNNAGDGFRLDGCFDCKIQGQMLDSSRAQSTSVINLIGGALRNQTWIAFQSAGVVAGNQYVQGTPTGNDVHVGADGGYQTPTFPSVLTWTVVAATDVVTTSAAHGLGVGDPVYLSTSSALPASTPQVVINTPYYVKTVPSTTTLTLAATPGGTTIDFTGTGTGTQSMQLPLLTDPYSGNTYKMTLTANVGVAAPVKAHQGQRLSFEFTQDATGSRAVTWENVFLLRNWTVLSRPSQVSSIDFVYDGTNWVQHGGITDALLSSTMGITTTSVSSTTTAETKSLVGTISGSFTCMPGFMTVGRKLRLKLSGVLTTGATAGTITFQVKFGGTVIASTGAIAPTISQTNKYWEAEIDVVCRTTGPTGTLFVQGKVSLMNAATPAAMLTWPVRGNSADPPAAVTVDTTATSLIDFQSITSNALHTITGNLAALEVLN